MFAKRSQGSGLAVPLPGRNRPGQGPGDARLDLRLTRLGRILGTHPSEEASMSRSLSRLLLMFSLLVAGACVAPDRTDYSPDDEVDDGGAVPDLGDDDDSVAGDDDSVAGDDDSVATDDDDAAADCTTADAMWDACALESGSSEPAPFCGLEELGGFTIDWDCVTAILGDANCAQGLPAIEEFSACFTAG